MPRSAIAVQDDIARTLVGIMPHPWKRIVLNFEVDDEDEDNSSSIFFHIAQAPSGELSEDDDMSLPIEVRSLLLELHAATLSSTGSRWGICDLLIEEDGRYNFTFDYGRAKRINGVLDESSYDRFKNYLTTYAVELASSGSSEH